MTEATIEEQLDVMVMARNLTIRRTKTLLDLAKSYQKDGVISGDLTQHNEDVLIMMVFTHLEEAARDLCGQQSEILKMQRQIMGEPLDEAHMRVMDRAKMVLPIFESDAQIAMENEFEPEELAEYSRKVEEVVGPMNDEEEDDLPFAVVGVAIYDPATNELKILGQDDQDAS